MCTFPSFIWGGIGWGKNVHITLHMYVLFRHAWGGAKTLMLRCCYSYITHGVCVCVCTCCHVKHGVGMASGWGKNVQVTLHMYVLPRHAWGGVGLGGARTFHVTVRMYVLLRHAWGRAVGAAIRHTWGGLGVGSGKNSHVTVLLQLHHTCGACVCTCCHVKDGVRLAWGGARTFKLRYVCPC